MKKILGKIFQKIAGYFTKDCMEVLGREQNLFAKFSFARVPQEIKNFEDLIFLFWSSPLNRGLIRMDLDEAAYLFKALRPLKEPYGVEIGRFKGGSTFLLASAMTGGRLLSVDFYQKMMLKTKGADYDGELQGALKKCGLAGKVSLVMADSGTYPNNGLTADFIFIDGDHTYEGVKKDYENWKKCLKSGSQIFFHDAAGSRPYSTVHEGVQRFVKELEQDNHSLVKVGEAGSLVHFRVVL